MYLQRELCVGIHMNATLQLPEVSANTNLFHVHHKLPFLCLCSMSRLCGSRCGMQTWSRWHRNGRNAATSTTDSRNATSSLSNQSDRTSMSLPRVSSGLALQLSFHIRALVDPVEGTGHMQPSSPPQIGHRWASYNAPKPSTWEGWEEGWKPINTS